MRCWNGWGDVNPLDAAGDTQVEPSLIPIVPASIVPAWRNTALALTLMDHATRPEFVHTHRWTEGDIVLWDNRCTMHRARAPMAELTRKVA
jgi:hypothetical protein